VLDVMHVERRTLRPPTLSEIFHLAEHPISARSARGCGRSHGARRSTGAANGGVGLTKRSTSGTSNVRRGDNLKSGESPAV
jgi:hypothetical protein